MDHERLLKGLNGAIRALFILLLVYSGLAMGMVRPADLGIALFLTSALLILMAVKVMVQKDSKVFLPAFLVAFGVFILYGIGHVVHGVASPYYSQVLLLELAFIFSVSLLVLNEFQDRKDARRILFVLVLIGVVSCFYALHQSLMFTDQVWSYFRPLGYGRRGSGFFINPNYFCGYLELLLPLMLTYVLMSRVGASYKLFLTYSIVMFLVGIGLSGSRGGWIATILGLVILAFQMLQTRYWKYGIAASGFVLLLIVTFFKMYDAAYIRLMVTMKNWARNDRIRVWESAESMWADHRWWGVGPDQFQVHYRQYRSPELQHAVSFTHNDYLQLMTDWGIIGGILFAAAFLALAYVLKKTLSRLKKQQMEKEWSRSDRIALLVGTQITLLILLVHSVFDSLNQAPALSVLVATITGLALAQNIRSGDRFRFSPPMAVRGLYSGGLILLAVWMGWQGWVHRAEARHYNAAFDQSETFEEQVRLLEKAWAQGTGNPDVAFQTGEVYRAQAFLGQSDFVEKTEKAIEWFELAHQAHPRNSLYLTHLGLCYDWLGQFDVALSYHEKALKVDPKGFYPISCMSWHYMEQNRPDEAKKWFKQAASLFKSENRLATTFFRQVDDRLKEASKSQ